MISRLACEALQLHRLPVASPIPVQTLVDFAASVLDFAIVAIHGHSKVARKSSLVNFDIRYCRHRRPSAVARARLVAISLSHVAAVYCTPSWPAVRLVRRLAAARDLHPRTKSLLQGSSTLMLVRGAACLQLQWCLWPADAMLAVLFCSSALYPT